MVSSVNKKLLDGKALASSLKEELQAKVKTFQKETGQGPGLAVCLVGEDPASSIYVRKKGEACKAIGMASFEHRLSKKTSTNELLNLIDQLNKDSKVNGILVQLPLPESIDSDQIIAHLNPLKDVDGFHPENVGLLSLGKPRFIPCTPLGIMKLLQKYHINVKGLNAVVIGRSNIVGKPIAQLLLKEHATVTICHSRTQNLPEIVQKADVLIAAIGKAHFVKNDWVKKGAVVIDVGINRGEGKKLLGDVDFENVLPKAKYITPVPGGVGPMTIACLLENTLQAARIQTQS